MHTRLTLTVAAGLALLAAPVPAPAQHPGGCIGRLRPDLGFSGMSFGQGTTYITKDLTLFGTEPILSGTTPLSLIDEGDALVAVDGALITTRDGAQRFAGIRPGVPVVLTLRRGGRNLDVRIVPRSICVPSEAGIVSVEPQASARPGRADTLTAEGPIAIGTAVGVSTHRGVLGVGLTCGPCSMKLLPGGRTEWELRGPPRIDEVAAGSPAARAGLRPGDLIESVDGSPVTSAEGGRRFGRFTAGKAVRLGILRGEKRLEVKIVPERAP